MREDFTSWLRELNFLQRAIVFIGALALAGVMVYPKIERKYIAWHSDGTSYQVERREIRMLVMDANFGGMPDYVKGHNIVYYPEVKDTLGRYTWDNIVVDRVDSIIATNLALEVAGLLLFFSGLLWVVTPRRESLVPDKPVSTVRRFEADDPHRFPA
jgi:hypothetical protein